MQVDDHSSGAEQGLFPNGAIVFGHFRIERFIAAGGKGRVYQAQDVLRNAMVALKVMMPNVSNADILRFQKEARLASKLKHSGIVTLYDFRIENNTPFLVMEYVEGRSLQDILEDVGVLDLETFVEVFYQLIKAVIYAHENGIVHRDLKPSNVIVSEVENKIPVVKILDFGIAKSISQDLEEARLTIQNAIVGSPLYMSPEQSKGEDVTLSSDSYSLGCMMWHALSGSPPYQADSVMEP